MDRQRSFSFKPTRLLVYSFTISSSIIFITFFTIWVTKSTPSVPPQQTHLQFNTSFLTLGLKPVKTAPQTLTGFGGNSSASEVKDLILINSHFRKSENVSGISGISVISGRKRKSSKSQVLEDEENKGDDSTGNEKNGVLSNEKIEERNASETSFNEIVEERREGPALEKKDLVSSVERIEGKKRGKCDFTRGRWVYEENYPLYTNASCRFIDEGFDCQGNGRPDKGYMKLRWQPQDCDIPRFNATKMLELMRGKRLVFVGDSINRNQWESMLCMLMGAVKDPKKVYETHGRRITKDRGQYSFRFVDYKCTVEYYVSHFLVLEGRARVGRKRVETLQIDSVDRGSSRWKGADVLFFNTAHWWSHYKTKAGINYYQEGGPVHPRLDVSTAFRKALTTWALWVDKYINPRKTQIFFRSSAPSHFRGGQWNSGGHCQEAALPLAEISSRVVVTEKNMIVEEVIKQMRTLVTVLNITALSEYRIDGHPSVYGKRSGKQYSSSVQDCSHWCLPGVPDSWNELLYAYLQPKSRSTGFRLVER